MIGSPRPGDRPGPGDRLGLGVDAGSVPRLHPSRWDPRAWLTSARSREPSRRAAQLPEAIEHMASSLRAGSSIDGALVAAASTCGPPLAAELRTAAEVLHRGGGLERALEAWQRAAGNVADVDLVTAALSLGNRAGGEVARALDRTAATLRERRELQAEVHALATQARASAAVLIASPLGFTALVSAIEPGVVRFLVASPIGLGCLAVGVALDAMGAVWMARIVAGAP